MKPIDLRQCFQVDAPSLALPLICAIADRPGGGRWGEDSERSIDVREPLVQGRANQKEGPLGEVNAVPLPKKPPSADGKGEV